MSSQVNDIFVFDFDSTVVTVESLDEILFLALKENPKADILKKEIERITDACMNGEMSFRESLSQRIQMAHIFQDHIDDLAAELSCKITGGMEEVIRVLQKSSHRVFIVSGGFLELIIPVANILNIPASQCFANTFMKENKKIIGFDTNNPLCNPKGKTKIVRHIRSLCPQGNIICIGDGMNDAKPFLEKAADDFWGFFQNKNRPNVREKASVSFDSSIQLLKHIEENIMDKREGGS